MTRPNQFLLATRRRRSGRGRAFTLVEILVVLGILALLMGVLLPVLIKARRASQATACGNNLRQIGVMLLMYSDANDDLLPMGITAIPESGQNPLSPSATWRAPSIWTCYLTILGSPTGNLGPLLSTGAVAGESGKILYCPADADSVLTWDAWRDRFPPRGRPPALDASIRISYFARPVNVWFKHTLLPRPAVQVIWPSVMLRYNDLRARSIFSERNSHGSEADPRMNVLYGDGAVKLVTMKRADRTPPNDGSNGQTPDDLMSPDTPNTDPNAARRIINLDFDYFDRE
jgi:prepilin-type N-terminal cleavage/methylation domain-containing protein